MKTVTKFNDSKAKGRVKVSDAQAEMLNNVQEAKIQEGDTIIMQPQYAHTEEVEIAINGKQQKVDSAQLYVDVICADGTEKQITLAVSTFNKYSFGKEFDGTILAKQTDKGVRGVTGTKRNPHVLGTQAIFRAEGNEKYLANRIAFKVGAKHTYAMPILERRGDTAIYDYKTNGDYLELENQELREFTNVPVPQGEYSIIPEEYAR